MGYKLEETVGFRLRRWLATAVRNDAIHYRKADLPPLHPVDPAPRYEGHLDFIIQKMPFEFRTYIQTNRGRVRVMGTADVYAIRDDFNVDAFNAGIMLVTDMFRFQGMFPTELNQINFHDVDSATFSKHCDLMGMVGLEQQFREAQTEALVAR